MLPFVCLDLWIILLGASSSESSISDVIRTSTGAYLWIPLGVICGVSTAVSFWLLGIRPQLAFAQLTERVKALPGVEAAQRHSFTVLLRCRRRSSMAYVLRSRRTAAPQEWPK